MNVPSFSPTADSTLAQLKDGKLHGATRLDLAADLTEFPREIFQLSDSLEILNLSGNRLSELPQDLNRLKKLRILFCSDNGFTELPSALGRCEGLSMVGFKSNRIASVSSSAFPPLLRWLILTDNRITELPGSIGRCPLLQKLMLTGNRLCSLPEELSRCTSLELVRVAANAISDLPDWLLEMPRLAWLAASGNPLFLAGSSDDGGHTGVSWGDIEPLEMLGEGASGIIIRARWRGEAVAVKLFKGAITSDGLPSHEMAAILRAGEHPNLIPFLAPLTDHPEQRQGIVMRLLPEAASIAASPPSLGSCTRDIYPESAHFLLGDVRQLSAGIAAAAAHLHQRGIMHGDLYAHNVAWLRGDSCFLSDLGAATCYGARGSELGEALQRLDVLAFGHFIGELLQRCADPAPQDLVALQRRCVSETCRERPLFEEILKCLGG